MKFLFSSLALLLLSLTGCSQPELSESDILDMTYGMQTATFEKDAEALREFFADDAEISMIMPAQLGGRVTMTLDQYIESIEQSWELRFDYENEHRLTDIQISDDGQSAVFDSTIVEKMKIRGKVLLSSSTEARSEVMLIDGEPKMIRTVGEISIK